MMFPKLFIAFTLIPLIELYILIKLGSVMGIFNTLALVVLTGLAGAYLAKMQGMQTMIRIRTQMQAGKMPAEDLIDAAIIFVAGVVLLTPGILTDIAGLLLLFPVTRFYFKRWARKKIDAWMKQPNVTIRRYPPGP
jgi:UPF0716 protein FxsA